MQCLWFPGYSQHLSLQSAGECGPIHPAQTGTISNLFSGRNIPDKNCTLRSISRDFPPPLTVISLSQAAETVTCTKADCRYNFCFQRK